MFGIAVLSIVSLVLTFGPSDWFTKPTTTVFLYTRISTDKQSADDKRKVKGKDGKMVPRPAKDKTTLKRQKKEVDELLAAQGMPKVKPENWFAEVASGSKGERTQWLAMREAAMNAKGRVVVVVKDPSRWARNVDEAVLAWAPLKKRGIPIYAIGTGIQTGTTDDKRPSENFFFLLNSGFAAQTSEVQSEKAKSGRDRQKAEGAAPFKGTSVYPFALRDPLVVFNQNLAVQSETKGVPRLKAILEDSTQPNGLTFAAGTSFIDRENARIAVLPADEYEEYVLFRQRLRERLQRLESDPWASKKNDAGKLDYKANALYRMSGLYLKDPQSFPMPTKKFLDDVEKNFVDFLSDKDFNRRAGKRSNRRR